MSQVIPSPVDYRSRLNLEADFAMADSDAYFRGEGAVHQAKAAIVDALGKLQISFAMVGALAFFHQRYRRFTEDVDLLVTRESLATIHDALVGLGYLHVFPGSRALRDTQTGVQIDFLVAGDYPGDGKPGPIAFPDPEGQVDIIDGLPILKLPRLVELKLASGLTGGLNRLKDIADIVEAVKRIPLDESLTPQLHPFVRDKYLEICAAVDRNETR